MPVACSYCFRRVRVDAVDLVEVLVEPARVVGRFAQHLGQVDVVERQHFADDIEDAVRQDRSHLVELLQQALAGCGPR